MKLRTLRSRWFVAMGVFLLAACSLEPTNQKPIVVTPAPGLPRFEVPTRVPGPYPIGTSSSSALASSTDGRRLSVLKSLPIAQSIAAAKFNSASQLYAVVPSSIMARNLGGLPVLPGWFYKFKVAGSRREFIVQIVDENVSGTTLAEPAFDVKPEELAIDPTSVRLDSPDVLERFRRVALQKGIKTDGVVFDLELINPSGGRGPVWSVVDSATFEWHYSISAISGEEVRNPHN